MTEDNGTPNGEQLSTISDDGGDETTFDGTPRFSFLGPENRRSLTMEATVDVSDLDDRHVAVLAAQARLHEEAFFEVYESLTESSIDRELSEDVIHEVVENARSLDPDDERIEVIDTAPNSLPECRLWLTTSLSTAMVIDSECVPAEAFGPDCESGEIHVTLEKSPIYFRGYGEGVHRFGIAADPETLEVRALNIVERLTAETQRKLARVAAFPEGTRNAEDLP